jgi:1,4-dihydroxy-2-naphthoate octaprenyltransferase
MRLALIFFLSIAFLLGSYLMYTGGIYIISIGLFSLYFAYGYTGGPFPLSHNGLGEVAAFLFFGIFAVSGTTYLQTHQFSALSFLLGAGPGFISATILAINNLRDIISDTEVNKRTIAVRFGEKFQRNLCLILIFLSSIILLSTSIIIKKYLLIPAIFLPLVFYKNWLKIAHGPIDRSLNSALAMTSVYLLVYSILSGSIIAFGN